MNGTYIIYVQIFFFLFETSQNLQSTFDDTVIDDQIDQFVIQISYSLGKTKIEIVRLLKISFIRNYSQKSCVRFSVRLMNKDCR